jgi:hypothetical protein
MLTGALAALTLGAGLGAGAAAMPQQQTDTTFAVRPDARLNVQNFGGTVNIKTWARNEVRVTAAHGRRDRVYARNGESVVSVGARSQHGPSGVIDFEITAPATMPITVEGTYTDISIDGTRAPISAKTVQGDVVVRGGVDRVELQSVQGRVKLEGARARVHANGTNKGIELVDVTGDVVAETINGDITLERVESSNVEAGTVNGTIRYDGSIRDGGTYAFTTHNGSVSVALPERPNATISTATLQGRISSDFPCEAPSPPDSDIRRRRRQTCTLGSGSARIEAESFSGTIRFRRRTAGTTRDEN